jgi:hypothetical protein
MAIFLFRIFWGWSEALSMFREWLRAIGAAFKKSDINDSHTESKVSYRAFRRNVPKIKSMTLTLSTRIGF